ncbi:hypothetical protein NPIL_118171 [Nephila pilipes]|uniref:Uncharacterized protein n=1 Tax=Nephila pilipes TaxID=299642 RepID=A0A8X6Q6P7_NEPPI|nr:hypothetical protein NPIL_118171 [Nephila pilipes]
MDREQPKAEIPPKEKTKLSPQLQLTSIKKSSEESGNKESSSSVDKRGVLSPKTKKHQQEFPKRKSGEISCKSISTEFSQELKKHPTPSHSPQKDRKKDESLEREDSGLSPEKRPKLSGVKRKVLEDKKIIKETIKPELPEIKKQDISPVLKRDATPQKVAKIREKEPTAAKSVRLTYQQFKGPKEKTISKQTVVKESSEILDPRLKSDLRSTMKKEKTTPVRTSKESIIKSNIKSVVKLSKQSSSEPGLPSSQKKKELSSVKSNPNPPNKFTSIIPGKTIKPLFVKSEIDKVYSGSSIDQSTKPRTGKSIAGMSMKAIKTPLIKTGEKSSVRIPVEPRVTTYKKSVTSTVDKPSLSSKLKSSTELFSKVGYKPGVISESRTSISTTKEKDTHKRKTGTIQRKNEPCVKAKPKISQTKKIDTKKALPLKQKPASDSQVLSRNLPSVSKIKGIFLSDIHDTQECGKGISDAYRTQKKFPGKLPSDESKSCLAETRGSVHADDRREVLVDVLKDNPRKDKSPKPRSPRKDKSPKLKVKPHVDGDSVPLLLKRIEKLERNLKETIDLGRCPHNMYRKVDYMDQAKVIQKNIEECYLEMEKRVFLERMMIPFQSIESRSQEEAKRKEEAKRQEETKKTKVDTSCEHQQPKSPKQLKAQRQKNLVSLTELSTDIELTSSEHPLAALQQVTLSELWAFLHKPKHPVEALQETSSEKPRDALKNVNPEHLLPVVQQTIPAHPRAPVPHSSQHPFPHSSQHPFPHSSQHPFPHSSQHPVPHSSEQFTLDSTPSTVWKHGHK